MAPDDNASAIVDEVKAVLDATPRGPARRLLGASRRTILPGVCTARPLTFRPRPTPHVPTESPLCEDGCGCGLTPVQAAKDARACSDRCRARAHRARRKARRLAEIDGAIRTLLELRADVERAP